MNTKKKVLLGGLGALTPIIMNLLVIELEIIFSNITLFAVLGYFIRVITLFYLGGLVAYLHKDEKSPIKIFELGIVAPALITAMLNAGHIEVPKAVSSATTDNLGAIFQISSVYAQETTTDSTKKDSANVKAIDVKQLKTFSLPKETTFQQFLRGLTGRMPENIWFVVVGSHKKYEDAMKQKKKILETKKDFEVDIYNPYRGNPHYAVVIGENLSYKDAQKLKEQAIKAGFPKDIYLWRIPNQD